MIRMSVLGMNTPPRIKREISTRVARTRQRVRPLFLLGPAMLLLAACSGKWETNYEPLDPNVTRGWRVSQVKVSVPNSLSVSDENVYVPKADIVWHGDPPGDRRAQVRQIVNDTARQASSGLRGGKGVVLEVTVQQFHGVSPVATLKAPAAVHNITMTAQIRDVRTGAALTEPSRIKADLPAQVGEAALHAAEYGPSQKELVSAHLVAVFKSWLGIGPDVRGKFNSVGR